MITRAWAFRVAGPPRPKGSMKCIGGKSKGGKVRHQLVEDRATSGPWRKLVTESARLWVLEKADHWQAIALELTYSLARPAGHYGAGRNAGTLKVDAPRYPTMHGTGDVDKLERNVLDALEAAGVLVNDAQVTDVQHRKRWCSDAYRPDPYVFDVLAEPGVVIRITPLTEVEDVDALPYEGLLDEGERTGG